MKNLEAIRTQTHTYWRGRDREVSRVGRTQGGREAGGKMND